MAQLSVAEQKMFAKYGGQDNLIDNDSFWLECLAVYMDTNIVLPMIDNAASARYLVESLKCPSGRCGLCCKCYKRIPICNRDITRFTENGIDTTVIKKDEVGDYLEAPCPFLKDNVCSIYASRPDTCYFFPVQGGRESVLESGEKFYQVQYRIKCPSSIEVVRKIFRIALAEGNSILLPDLSLVQKEAK